MKVDRRSFLSFLIGGAAGTALSPLPWKLTDDISIWTQMWPWTPVPPKGEVTYVNSVCTLCPGGCGISVRKVGDRVVKIEGLEGHPVNDGGICNLGLAGPQLLYGPRRVRSPLKKVNGSFREISWADAIAEITAALKASRNDAKADQVACIANSDAGTMPALIQRFMTQYGSPNFIRMPSIQDTYELTFQLMHGVSATPGFDIQSSDFILSFGSGVLDGWGSPVYWFKAHSRLRDNGGTFVQIEPRLSNTAAKSDNWVPVYPGTEGALALGLAHVIIKEALYNRDFTGSYSAGFDRFERAVLDGYSPKIVSELTGVDASQITKLARQFAAAQKPIAVSGRGQGSTPGGIREFMAVHALNALVGNINQNGGLWGVPQPDYIQWPEAELDSIATSGIQTARIDGAGSKPFPQTRFLATQFPEQVNSAAESPVQILFVVECNPAHSLPDSDAVQNAFSKIPLKVSFSSFMDETAQLCDYILPNHIYLERYEDVPTASGYPKPIIGLCQPVVEPQFNTRHVGDVFIQFAHALGGNIADAFAWDTYEDCLKETLEDNWDELEEAGFWVDNGFTPAAWPEAFETESSAFEFVNRTIGSWSRFSPVKAEGDKTVYPYTLIPYDSMRLATGYIGSPPFLIKSVEDTVLKGNDVFVEVNPKTADEQGLKDGDTVMLSTPKGKAKARVRLFEGVMPNVVALPRGLGHTANDQFIAGKGINFNQLIGPVADSASGLDAAWGIHVKLDKG